MIIVFAFGEFFLQQSLNTKQKERERENKKPSENIYDYALFLLF